MVLIMDINELTRLVTKDIDEDWPTIYKIRYVYLELGKYLSKDTDFFFSCDNKLFELNMNYDEIKRKYESLTGDNNKVICRSASEILKYIYESIGIKSRLVKQINKPIVVNMDDKELIINHYFLAVDDENDTYFMTFASDLPFIKERMKTRLFANDIPYKRVLPNGEEEQIYEGEEIKHRVLKTEELAKIDKEIGYIRYYYNYDNDGHKRNRFYEQYNDAAFLMLKEKIKGNKWYYEILAEHTNFYKTLYNFYTNDSKMLSFDKCNLNDFRDEDINEWVYLLCQDITKRICLINNMSFEEVFDQKNFNYEEWLENICNKQLKLNGEFNYSKWSKEMKKDIKYNEYDYNSLLAILDKTNAIVTKIRNRDPKNFNNLLLKLSYHFIDRSRIIDLNNKTKFIENKYLAYKLVTLFPKIFSANDEITPFNKREYSEQIVLIKEILEIMFPELNKKNSNIENYNDLFSPTFNRIQTYTVKNKETLEYALIFNVVGDNKNGNYYFFYDPKKNIFHVADILEIYQDYVILSERFKSILEDTTIPEQKKR